MSPKASINALYQAIIDNNVDLISQNYILKDHIYPILKRPRLATTNYSNMAKAWINFCQSDLTMNSIGWQEGPREKIGEELAWVSGVIKLVIGINEKKFKQFFRVSYVLEHEKNQWKIRDEHISGELEDPYGIGNWFKK